MWGIFFFFFMIGSLCNWGCLRIHLIAQAGLKLVESSCLSFWIVGLSAWAAHQLRLGYGYKLEHWRYSTPILLKCICLQEWVCCSEPLHPMSGSVCPPTAIQTLSPQGKGAFIFHPSPTLSLAVTKCSPSLAFLSMWDWNIIGIIWWATSRGWLLT